MGNYFPSGSRAINSIKTRIENGIRRGALQINGPVLALEDLRTIINEDRKEAKNRHYMQLAVTIVLAIVGIVITAIFL